MNVVELHPYKALRDDELLENIHTKMKTLRKLSEDINYEEYWKEVTFFNEMIIEAKRRNLKVNNEILIRNIFIE